MINHKHKIIFVHIPRTSGTSIEDSFGTVDDSVKHINAAEINGIVRNNVWSSYFKFSFVRNPWDRMISMYHQPAFAPIGIKTGKSLRFFLKNYEPFGWEHGVTFCDYLNYGEMDFVGRFENRIDDLQTISNLANVKIDINIHKRRTSDKIHSNYSNYYDAETVRIVRKTFAEDIERFEYEF